jgi:ribosomal silencing factor RsfS
MVWQCVIANNKCIQPFKNDSLENLSNGAKKTDWAIIDLYQVLVSE